MLGIALGAEDRNKLRFDEGPGLVLSGGSFEGAMDGNIEDGIEELEAPVMECQLGRMLENLRDQVRYWPEQMVTWIGPEGGP